MYNTVKYIVNIPAGTTCDSSLDKVITMEKVHPVRYSIGIVNQFIRANTLV